MDWGWITAVTGFALAMAGTPGPNNTMVTASGATHGFWRTLPLMSGMAIGVAAIILAVGAAGASIVSDPRIRAVLKWAGCAYLLWLAWRIGRARPARHDIPGRMGAGGRPLTLMQGALFQFVNPKLWIMVAGAFVAFGGTAAQAASFAVPLVFAAVFGTATFASTAAWTLVGVGASRLLTTERSLRLFNWTMAALLAASLIPVLTE